MATQHDGVPVIPKNHVRTLRGPHGNYSSYEHRGKKHGMTARESFEVRENEQRGLVEAQDIRSEPQCERWTSSLITLDLQDASGSWREKDTLKEGAPGKTVWVVENPR